MSKTVLAKVDGFTPLIDSIVKEYGVLTAAVFGRVWRYCQMETGVCQASVEKIAGELDLSVRTIIRHLDVLVEGGYLVDNTPGLRNKPHTYSDTGKASFNVSINAMTESHSGMSQSHSDYDTKSEQGMTESQLKIVSLREDLRELNSSDKKSYLDEFGCPIDPEEEVETQMSTWFTELTDIMAYDNDKWLRSCQNMVKNKVTRETLQAAIELLRDKEYSIAGPWSVEKTAISKAANRADKPRGEIAKFDENGRII